MADPIKKYKTQGLKTVGQHSSMINVIKDRQSEEIVIALCGSIGSGTSTIAKKIEEIFVEYSYSVNTIKISNLIKNNIELIKSDFKEDAFLKDFLPHDYNSNSSIDDIPIDHRIAILQSAGNILRKKESNDILAQLAINEIALDRDGYEKKNDINSDIERKSRRHVTIIDSLKNPDEAKLLQLVYQEMFYLFGVLCPAPIRKKRLIGRKLINESQAIKLMERDKSEGQSSGQQMLKTILHSDFFVTNINENIDSLKPSLKRYIKITMGDKSITPTVNEIAMFHAYSASVKSGCLSRQVGAAIIDRYGNLISTGCNDVPRSGGGLYSQEDGVNDCRCMYKYGGECQNEKEKNIIFNEIESIVNRVLSKENETEAHKIISEIRSHPRLKSLIEFCRAIHAEMDAITSVARNGKDSLIGSTLFCTTFPCHNCARHIVAAGISKVYYIEPYEKSMALQLHGDSISFDRSDCSEIKKTQFLPFEGVGPRKYLNLFHADNRKSEGARRKFNRQKAMPSIPVFMETRYEYESRVVKYLSEQTSLILDYHSTEPGLEPENP